MKRASVLILAMVILLSGCTAARTSSGDTASVDDTTATSSIQSMDTSAEKDAAVSGDTSAAEEVKQNAYASLDRTVLADSDQLRFDYKRLPEIESITAEQISRCMITTDMGVTTTKDPAYKAKDADAALKFTFNKNMVGGQAIFAEKLKEKLPNGLDEAVVLDPVDGSLSEYEGIRYYVKVKRPDGKKYSKLTIRFMFGTYSYYRLFYQYTSVLPEGDYEGYVYVPFNEMVSGYNDKVKAVGTSNISFFGFNIALEGNAEGLEVYLSDFSAYREMFW